MTLGSRCGYSPRVTDEESKAQRCEATRTQTHSWSLEEMETDHELPDSAPAQNHLSAEPPLRATRRSQRTAGARVQEADVSPPPPRPTGLRFPARCQTWGGEIRVLAPVFPLQSSVAWINSAPFSRPQSP